MKSSPLIASTGVTLLSLAALDAQAQLSECPGADPTPLHTSYVNMAFDSLVRSTVGSTTHRFERCIINYDSSSAFYFDWPSVDLEGYVYDEPVLSSYDSNTAAFELVPSVIYLGLAHEPHRIQYRRSMEEVPLFQKFLRSTSKIFSHVRMWIPLVRDDPASIEAVDVSVSSEFVQGEDPTSFEYIYTWNDSEADDREPFRFLWNSETILGMLSEPEGVLRLSSEEEAFSFSYAARPAYGLVSIKFLDENGAPVGEAPIAIYYPEVLRP